MNSLQVSSDFDVIIIGGSYAGMATVLYLASVAPDLKIALIEKQDIINTDKKTDGRALAISRLSLELFKQIEIYDKIVDSAGLIKDIKITDHKSPIILDFLGKEVDKKSGSFGLVVESYALHNALRNQLLKQKNIKIFCPKSYQEISFDNHLVSVVIDDQSVIKSKLLLACDGRFSKLRDHFNIHTTRKDYHQKAIVFNIKHQKPHQNIAHEKFLPYGPLAILPLKDQNQSSIVWILRSDEADAVLGLNQLNFTHQLLKKMQDHYGELELGEVEIISEKFSYPLIMIEADQFYHDQMVLVGDAACGVHPIAGQGLNLGLVGIKILVELMKEYHLCGLDLNSQILIKQYNKKAKFAAKKMIIATDVLNSLFETKNPAVKLARNLGLGVVSKISILKNFFIKNAGGIT